jgi:hypothetical protein
VASGWRARGERLAGPVASGWRAAGRGERLAGPWRAAGEAGERLASGGIIGTFGIL